MTRLHSRAAGGSLRPASPASTPASRSWFRLFLGCIAGLMTGAWQEAYAAQVTLAWQDNASNETGFRIERAAATGSYTEIATTGANVTTYVDTSVTAGTTYLYRVSAYNNVGASPFSNVAQVALPVLNTAPTISSVANQTINAGGSTAALAFTIGDAESAASSLSVSAASSNTMLVPLSAVVLGGSGASRTIVVTPVGVLAGTATITITVSDGALTTTETFTVTVNVLNTAPTISAISNRTIPQDTDTGAIAFTVGDAQSTAGSLAVSGSTSNATLVPASALTFGGSGANRTLVVTPAAGQSGTATITVTVSDGALTDTDSFVLTVAAVAPANTAPTLGNISNRSVNEDGTTGAIAFTVDDAESSASALTLTATSSNTALVPNTAIVLGGSGANRTLTVTPAADQSGSATITVMVSDGELTDTDSFVLTVTAVNDAPTLSNLAARTIDQDTSTGAISFAVDDPETAAGSLVVSGSSSNPALVPGGAILLGGTGATRTITITPAAGESGTATITVIVSDGALTAQDTFVLTVTEVAPANTAPTLSNIANRSVNEDGTTGAIAFTVDDEESSASTLTLTATSSNTALVPNAAIVLGGSGANRTLTVTPAADQNGSATITVIVSDGELTDTDSFVLTVTAVNDAPTLSNLTPRTIDQDTSTGAITFAVDDPETAAGSLVVSSSSSNPALVPGGAILLGGSGATRTITITPAAGESGTATITVIVSDGALTAQDTFVLTVAEVTPPNTAPTLGNVANRTIDEDGTTGAIAFTVDDAETPASALTLTATSSNTALVPNAAIILSGTGGNRSVTVTPSADQSGTATITLTASDGELTDSEAFVVTVTARNDAPAISGISSRTIDEDTSTGAMAFTVSDVETAAASLQLAGSSSNTTLVPNAAITFGGSGANRTVTVTPAAGASGSASITLSVSDGTAATTTSFTLTVTSVNAAPTISNVFSRTIPEDGTSGAINFTIADAESDAADLIVTATSSNPTLVPSDRLVLSGTGRTRTVEVTPAANENGRATITLTVSDGALTDTDTFNVTVSAVNDQPTLSAIADQTISQDAATGALAFTVDDVETAAGSLTLSATSSDLILVPAANVVFGGSGATRTVTVTPVAGESGSTTITVVVSDGVATRSEVFTVTVNAPAPANEPPSVTPIPDQAANSNGSVGPVTFSIADDETAAAGLTLTAASSNPGLVPTAGILLTGTGSTRSLTITPAAGQSGTATITIFVSDGTNTTSTTFTITVAAAPLPEARMLNLSTRVVCRPGQDMLIPGFVINGTADKRILLRAVGPTLAGEPFNVPGTLANPRLVLKRWDGAEFVDHAANDDWGAGPTADAIRQTAADVFAFPLVEGSQDAALLLDLSPGRYTVFVDDANPANSGVVIVELYDADTTVTGSTFINMSDRGHVGTGAEVMISGFVVSSEGPKTLLIRAVGPGLAVAPFNVPGTISDPVIDIYRRELDGSDTLVLTHDNWSDGADTDEVAAIAAQVSAFPLPVGSKDAAVVSTLQPGVYTVVVRGVDNATGTALVEVYTVE